MLTTLVHELHRTEESRLRNFFMRRLRNAADAADATQEPLGYLYRTAHSVAVDKARRNATRSRIESPITDERAVLNVPADVPSPETVLIDRERLAQFETALLALPERARTVLLLNRREGWTLSAIAEHLQVSPSTVYNDLKMAMSHCMAAMTRLERR